MEPNSKCGSVTDVSGSGCFFQESHANKTRVYDPNAVPKLPDATGTNGLTSCVRFLQMFSRDGDADPRGRVGGYSALRAATDARTASASAFLWGPDGDELLLG